MHVDTAEIQIWYGPISVILLIWFLLEPDDKKFSCPIPFGGETRLEWSYIKS